MNHADLDAWIARYKRSWEELDTELFLSLFTGDAIYQSSPFSLAAQGPQLRMMWDGLKTRQADNHIAFRVWSLQGDTAILQWTARSTWTDGGPKKGDGIFIMVFAPDGRCSSLREWQHWHPADAPPIRGVMGNL